MICSHENTVFYFIDAECETLVYNVVMTFQCEFCIVERLCVFDL